MEQTSFNFYQETAEQLLELDNETIGKFFRALVEERLNGETDAIFTGLEKMSYTLIRGQLDRARQLSEKRSQTGARGGAPVGNQNATDKQAKNNQKTTKEQANDNQKTTKEQANDNQKTTKKQANDKQKTTKEQAKTSTNTNTNTSTITSTNTITNTELPPAGADSGKRIGRAENTYPPKSKKNVRKESKPEKTMFAEFVSMTNEEYASLVTKLGEQGAKRCVEILDNYKGASGKKYDSDYRAILNWVVKRYEEEQEKASGARGSHSYNLNAYEALAVNVPKTAGETKPVSAGQEDKSPSNGWESFDQLAVNRQFKPQEDLK